MLLCTRGAQGKAAEDIIRGKPRSQHVAPSIAPFSCLRERKSSLDCFQSLHFFQRGEGVGKGWVAKLGAREKLDSKLESLVSFLSHLKLPLKTRPVTHILFPLKQKWIFHKPLHHDSAEILDLLQKLACKCQQQIVYFHLVTVKRLVKNPFLPSSV